MKSAVVFVRQVGCSLRSRALRWLPWFDPYARTLGFLERSRQWDGEVMAEWQLGQLNGLLRQALDHCPGHSRRLRAAGFTGAVARVADIQELPFLTKDDLRAQADEFVARNFRREWLRAITSGGTTGTPTRFWADARSYDAVFAAWRHAMWRRVGHAPGSRCLDITWAFVRDKPLRASGEPGRVYLSINALDADQLELWWRDVAALRPQFIIGYPSTATALAKLLPRAGALAEVRALILASETLSRHQEGVLRTSFPTARIFQWYGMSEMAGFASGCEQADAFHHWPQSGILEVIGEDGRPVERPGDVGEIVLTGFANWATPFLRYRTGDRATLGPPCPHCGGARPVLARIEGRLDDYLLGARGRVVPLSALNYHGEEFRRVFAHQFIQEAPGQVLLRVVASPGFASQDLAAIRRLMEEKLGPDLMLTIEQAASIPRTARGKQPLIVQRCPRPRGGVEPRPDVCRP